MSNRKMKIKVLQPFPFSLFPFAFHCLLFAFIVCSPALADVLHLVNGGRIEGKVTRVKDGYWLENGTGRVFFRNDQVKRWEKLPTVDEDYQALRGKVRLDDFDGQMALARWCRKNNLQQMARWHYMIAVALRSDDARARRGAGYVRVDGKWVTAAQAMESKGLARYKGRWMPAEEAARRRIKDTRNRERFRVNREAWSLIRKTARQRSDAPLEPVIAKLVAMGQFVIFPLERASNDGSMRARKLVLMVLGRMRSRESRELLLRRLRVEKTRQLALLAARLLAGRPDRKEVLGSLLNITINHPTRMGRHRAWLGLLAAADKRVIDVLVPKVEYCPVAAQNGSGEAGDDKTGDGKKTNGPGRERKVSFNGKEYVTGQPKPRKPYYPAHEALVYLTGELLPPEAYAWRNWWEKKRDDFEFRK